MIAKRSAFGGRCCRRAQIGHMNRSVFHIEPTLSHISLLAVGIVAGAVVMYFFDVISGGRRRALVRDKIVGAGHDAAYFAQAKGKRAADHVKGLFTTRRLDRVTRSEPQSDQQLHDRIRARLGRVIRRSVRRHLGAQAHGKQAWPGRDSDHNSRRRCPTGKTRQMSA